MEKGKDKMGISAVSTQQGIKQKREFTVIIISHQERIIELADKVVLLKNGVVTDVDTPDKILPKIVGKTIYTCPTKNKNNK